MHKSTLYPKKPERLLNIHFRLSLNADAKLQTVLREACQLLATFEIIECNPEKAPDIVIAEFDTSFAVLQDRQLMSQIQGNLWVLMAAGVKMPELMGAGNSNNAKMRRLTPFGRDSLHGQLLLLVSMYDQEYNEDTHMFPMTPGVASETKAAA